MRTEMMYKIMNNLVDVPTDTILLPSYLQLRGHFNNYPVEWMLMSILFFHKELNYGMLYPNT